MQLTTEVIDQTWHYPTNLPIRDYQYSIAESCLKDNTLVILPTGLGKTFIASVVIFNFRRWFPDAKIIFMAPTRPLVTQQMEAAQKIVEVNLAEMVELTGAQIPSERERLWKSKGLFFMTPHVLQNDLITGICPGKEICLLVFDEAHKATGKYAYCEILKILASKYENTSMRIVALTATPASSLANIQQLIDALKVTKIEYRSEESPDVSPYSFKRDIRQVIVEPSDYLVQVQNYFQDNIMQKYYLELRRHNAMSEMPIHDMQSFRLIKERDACRVRMHGNPVMGMIEGSFGMLISLTTSNEILSLHGIVPFYNQLSSQEGESGPIKSRLKNEFDRNPAYQKLSGMIKELYNQPEFVSHPKIKIVEDILVEHFKQTDTRAIIFAQYRESVKEIVSRLMRHAPKIKAMTFMGQSAATSTSKAFTQKQQMEVLKCFREGGYNVLVSTSIGEEGLDIGNVDLIICYDMQSSPIRFLQRIGRTGRQRAGQIVLLTCKGREEQRYEQTKAQERYFAKAIQSPQNHFKFFPSQSLSITDCIKREFVINFSSNQLAKPRKKSKKESNAVSNVVHYDAFNLEMLDKCPQLDINKHVLREASRYFTVSHSSRCERYLQVLRTFKQLEDKELLGNKGIPALHKDQSHVKSLDDLMSRWEYQFDAEDLEQFFTLTLPIIKTKGKFSKEIELEIPDDFFDFDEIELAPIASGESSVVRKENLPTIDHNSDLTALAEVRKASTPLIVRNERANVFSPNTQTPLVLRKRLQGPVVSSSLQPTPVKQQTNKLNARRFVDSQAFDDGTDEEENEQEGLSEMGSFIDDGTELEETEGSEMDSNNSTPCDMMSFYRQSLLHSQPFGGFATGSKYVHKPPARKPSNLCSAISEDEEEALAGIVEWDSSDEFL